MGKTERNTIEAYFEWWLDDCFSKGYIDKWDRESEQYTLFPEYRAFRMKYFKSKPPEREVYNLLRNDTYTYDYRIVWNESAKFLFYNPSDFTDPNNPPTLIYKDTYFHASYHMGFKKFVSFIDVKPPAAAARFSGSLNSFSTFPTKQKALLWNYNIYINKVVPIPMSGSGEAVSLFPNTFTPVRFFRSDGGDRNRKINYRINTIDKFVQQRQSFIDSIDAMVRKANDKPAKQGDLFYDK